MHKINPTANWGQREARPGWEGTEAWILGAIEAPSPSSDLVQWPLSQDPPGIPSSSLVERDPKDSSGTEAPQDPKEHPQNLLAAGGRIDYKNQLGPYGAAWQLPTR